MELNYLVGDAPKSLKSLEMNYQAHNNLMSNIQLCGVFSDKLIERVYSLSWVALGVVIDIEKGDIKLIEGSRRLKELNIEFQGLFNSYNIFSQEFKIVCFELFNRVRFINNLL